MEKTGNQYPPPPLEIVWGGGGGVLVITTNIELLSVDLVPVVWKNWFKVIQSSNWAGIMFPGP